MKVNPLRPAALLDELELPRKRPICPGLFHKFNFSMADFQGQWLPALFCFSDDGKTFAKVFNPGRFSHVLHFLNFYPQSIDPKFKIPRQQKAMAASASTCQVFCISSS